MEDSSFRRLRRRCRGMDALAARTINTNLNGDNLHGQTHLDSRWANDAVCNIPTSLPSSMFSCALTWQWIKAGLLIPHLNHVVYLPLKWAWKLCSGMQSALNMHTLPQLNIASDPPTYHLPLFTQYLKPAFFNLSNKWPLPVVPDKVHPSL